MEEVRESVWAQCVVCLWCRSKNIYIYVHNKRTCVNNGCAGHRKTRYKSAYKWCEKQHVLEMRFAKSFFYGWEIVLYLMNGEVNVLY